MRRQQQSSTDKDIKTKETKLSMFFRTFRTKKLATGNDSAAGTSNSSRPSLKKSKSIGHFEGRRKSTTSATPPSTKSSRNGKQQSPHTFAKDNHNPSRSRARSSDTRKTSASIATPTTTPINNGDTKKKKPLRSSSSKDIRLRSKSPSRQRIQDFMNDMKARERSASREKNLSSGSTTRTTSKERIRKIKYERSRSNSELENSMSTPNHRRSTSSGNYFLESDRRSTSEKKVLLDQGIVSDRTYIGGQQSRYSVSPSLSGASCHSSERRLQHFLEQTRRSKTTSSPDKAATDDSSFGKSDLMSRSSTRYSIEQHTTTGNDSGVVEPPKRSKSFLKRLSRRQSKEMSDSRSLALQSDDPEIWFTSIAERDWSMVDQLISNYDYKKYHPKRDDSLPKAEKLFRGRKFWLSQEALASKQQSETELVSPLLMGDSNGRTPLHVACQKFMPWKMVQRLYFIERNAACVLDDDDRLPLHLALIANHDIRILDKLIYGNPDGLLVPDKVGKKTPLAYAILRAEHKGDKNQHFTWKPAVDETESQWQSEQFQNFVNTQFVLDEFVKRRKLISKSHESTLLLDVTRSLAPPPIINAMLSVSARILQQDERMADELFYLLVSGDYPIDLFQKAIKICTGTMHVTQVMSFMRRSMINHFEKARISHYRTEFKQTITHCEEMLQIYKRREGQGYDSLTNVCQAWWRTMKFLIGYAAEASMQTHELDEAYLLQTSLQIPEVPVVIIEYILRLMPNSIYVKDREKSTLPIHTWCMCMAGYPSSRDALKILRLVLANDWLLAKSQLNGRLPLHLAAQTTHDWPFLKTIIDSYPQATRIPDPLTRLCAFQLGALDTPLVRSSRRLFCQSTESIVNNTKRIDLVYRLLRLDPIALSSTTIHGSGGRMDRVGPTTSHVVQFCYVCKDNSWHVNEENVQFLRESMSRGSIVAQAKHWFQTLKSIIWKTYDWLNAGIRMVYMPHEDIYLLHAAISNGDTPPIVVELLLEIFSNAASTPIPGTEEYPVHIAARSPIYIPLPFERTICIHSVLEMVALAYPDATQVDFEDKTLLEIAIISGKTWKDLKSIVQTDVSYLHVRDLSSRLLPYQAVASQDTIIPYKDWVQARTVGRNWNDFSPQENGLFLGRLCDKYQAEWLTSIFEILRWTVKIPSQ